MLSSAIADDFYGGRNIRSGSQFVQNREIFFNDTYFFGQNGFFDVGDNLRVRNLETAYDSIRRQNEALRQKVDQLEQKIRDLNNRLNNTEGGPPIQPLPPGIPPIALPPFNTPPPIVPLDNNSAKLDKAVLQIFTRSCSNCHSEDKAKGNFSLVSRTGNLSPLSAGDIASIRTRTVLDIGILREMGLQPMPQGGPRLPQKDIELIMAWAEARISVVALKSGYSIFNSPKKF